MVNFVEQATLKVTDKSTRQVQKINRALKDLFRTSRQLERTSLFRSTNVSKASTAVRRLTRDFERLRSAQAGVRNLRFATPTAQQIGRVQAMVKQLQKLQSVRAGAVRFRAPTTPQIQRVEKMTRALKAYSAAARKVPIVNFGTTGSAGVGGTTGQAPLGPRVQRPTLPPPNNVFWSRRQDDNWSAAGRIIARSFVASVGFNLHQAVMRAGRSAREGIATEDTAAAVAFASGVDVEALRASSRKAADATLGVNVGEIMSAATEQAGALTSQFKTGQISLAEFESALDATTRRVAEMAQMQGTATGNFSRGAEDARQIEKAVNLTMAGLDQAAKTDYSRAVMNAIIASGGDITGNEVKRMLQQLGSTAASSLSPEGLARLVLLRDEGGRQSTAEIRMAVQDLIRGNLNKEDKAAAVRAGLRGRDGSTVFGQADLADPVAFAIKEILPRVREANIDTNDAIALGKFLDETLGFTTSGSRAFARILNQIEQFENEFQRLQQTQSQRLLEQPTLTAAFAEINTSFQDAIGRAAEPLVPAITGAARGVGEMIERIGQGGIASLRPGDLATLATAGVGVSMAAIMNPATRPLGTAALGLNVAATNLNVAATSLTAAAGAQATGGLLRGRAGGVLRAGGAAAASVGGFLLKNRKALSALALFDLVGSAVTHSLSKEGQKNIAKNMANPETAQRFDPMKGFNVLGEAEARTTGQWKEWEAIQQEHRAAMTQTYETGATNLLAAGQNTAQSIADGADRVRATLSDAFTSGANIIAQRITGAIANSPVMVQPNQAPASVGNTQPIE